MEQVRGFTGGLNTDDSIEIISPEDYTYAVNFISGRSSIGKNGTAEQVRGTNPVGQAITVGLINADFGNGLAGWENVGVIKTGLNGSASLNLSAVGEGQGFGDKEGSIWGTATLELAKDTAVVTNITPVVPDPETGTGIVRIWARTYAGVVPAEAFRCYVKLLGFSFDGQWFLGYEGNPFLDPRVPSDEYRLIVTINNVISPMDIVVGVENTIDNEIQFGEAGIYSNVYNNYYGRLRPYTKVIDVAAGNLLSDIYLNIPVDFGSLQYINTDIENGGNFG